MSDGYKFGSFSIASHEAFSMPRSKNFVSSVHAGYSTLKTGCKGVVPETGLDTYSTLMAAVAYRKPLHLMNSYLHGQIRSSSAGDSHTATSALHFLDIAYRTEPES